VHKAENRAGLECLHCLSHILVCSVHLLSPVAVSWFATQSETGTTNHIITPISLHRLCSQCRELPDPILVLQICVGRHNRLSHVTGYRNCFVKPHLILFLSHQTHIESFLRCQFCSFSFIPTPSVHPLS
jgi:hypothetical protein